ncbi:MAG: Gfo/Idh/MocA family oxidoreductase, partial [Alphaproteobacteria bacterium]|nr:Gfo/Idh/MocA family oxidoreductase [Alphaproteobacteria bacterium]
MSLHRMLLARAAENKPLRVGLIGAGKFGAMYLSQIPTTPGIHLLGIADLAPAKARENLARLGWKPEVTAAGSFAEAWRNGNTHLTDDWRALVSQPGLDVVVEATGDPIAAVEHALEAFRNGKHVVMVTVEADAFCGPLLAKRASAAGVIYSLAYGD